MASFTPTIKYRCNECGWIYDPEYGSTVEGKELAPGTEYVDLPEDWECPECENPAATGFSLLT